MPVGSRSARDHLSRGAPAMCDLAYHFGWGVVLSYFYEGCGERTRHDDKIGHLFSGKNMQPIRLLHGYCLADCVG
jgi:hypothetical protein